MIGRNSSAQWSRDEEDSATGGRQSSTHGAGARAQMPQRRVRTERHELAKDRKASVK